MENTESTIIAAEKSTHRVETFILTGLLKHPNADTLSIIRIPDTDYTYICKTEEWLPLVGKLVAWIQPDSIVDVTRPEFAFLGKETRIRAKKLRGIVSYGVLVLAPEGLNPGDDAAAALGVEHYDPEIAESKNSKSFSITMGEVAKPPKGVYPRYDVDAFLKYAKKVFIPNETVYVTEKLHGFSTKFLFRDGVMYCGSRNEWKKEWTTPPKITLEELTSKIGNAEKANEVYTKIMNGFTSKKSTLWTLMETTPGLREFCEAHPGWCIYGEAYGNVKNFRYGRQKDDLGFRAFDILSLTDIGPKWLDADVFFDTCNKFGIPTVPLMQIMPYDFDKLVQLAEGNTTLEADHIREGVVVKPKQDRWDPSLGRVSLKIINPRYLEIN